MELIANIFQTLTKLGGGSELVPLLVFCLFLVAVGLGVGTGVMRLLRLVQHKPATEAEETQ